MSEVTVPTSTGRTLVLCFDGQLAQHGKRRPTNVMRLFRALEKNNEHQICYYRPGIGTYIPHTRPFWRLMSKMRISQTIDALTGWHLEDHVIGGYEFLMQHYTEGDRICILGISTGGYIARCLAGMLHSVGLLPRGNVEQVPFAYATYKLDRPNKTFAHDFKHAFGRNVKVDFLGVWMCTRAVGRTYKRTLPHTSPKGTAKVFRQALALDESWHGYEYWPWVDTPSGTDQLTRGDSAKTDSISVACELCPTETTEDDTNHEEVWFSGNNWDVGGGFSRVAPVERRSAWAEATSNPSLLWMVGQIEKANVGVIWVDDTSDHARKVWHYLKEVSSGGSALNDTVFNPIKELARNPIRDERSALTRVVRRAFEFLPLADDFNAVTGKRGLRIVWNPRPGRKVTGRQPPRFHFSTEFRFDDKLDYKYVPKTSFGMEKEYEYA